MPRNRDELSAFSVYTVCDESKYLIVRNVPALECGDELGKLFASYGDIEEFAKRKLDEFVLLGNRLQVSYAPHYESLENAKEKLECRRKEVLARLNPRRAGRSSAVHKPDVSKDPLCVASLPVFQQRDMRESQISSHSIITRVTSDQVRKEWKIRLFDSLDPKAKTLGVRRRMLEMGKEYRLRNFGGDVARRKKVIGTPFTRAEIQELLKPHIKSNCQVNLGKDWWKDHTPSWWRNLHLPRETLFGVIYPSLTPLFESETTDDPKSCRKTVISSPKMMSLWKHAIELNKALLLEEVVAPDDLLEIVEEFNGLSQAKEHSYPALIYRNNEDGAIISRAEYDDKKQSEGAYYSDDDDLLLP